MAVTASLSPQRESLAVEALRRNGRLRLRLRGESMLPTLWPGDIAEIDACGLEEVRDREIVLAVREGRFFLHRLLACERNGFLTRGDSMPGPDPMFPAGALLGKLTSVVRAGKAVPAPIRPWSRWVGMLLCHCSLARRVAFTLHSSGNSQRRQVAELEGA